MLNYVHIFIGRAQVQSQSIGALGIWTSSYYGVLQVELLLLNVMSGFERKFQILITFRHTNMATSTRGNKAHTHTP